jgi:hypothetical protein
MAEDLDLVPYSVQATKESINELEVIKITNLCYLKITINKVKDNSQN